MARTPLAAGTMIDDFLLEQGLHQGSAAAVWRVSHPDFADPIVMKVPVLDSGGDSSLLVGFEVEQMIMAELSGPHVPRLVATGDFTVQPYIVMEYVAGLSLARRLAEPPIALDEVIRGVMALAEAVGDLHQQHVLHLDLKPASVLFREQGVAVIIDFSRSRHEHLPDLLAEQGRGPAGATEYMAPEQLLSVRSDKRSDIFALGAIAYHMATGELPFGKPARVKDVRRRVWRDPVPPRKLRPEIGAGLQEVILKCLEPIPDRRYATAEELSFDLRHLDLVELTERAGRAERADMRTTVGRWLRARGTMTAIAAASAKPALRAPIILVVIDLQPGLDQLRRALLEAAASVMANMPGARLACLNVIEDSQRAGDGKADSDRGNVHIDRMIKLRSWAQPLQLPRGKVTYHLVESRNLARGVLDFAKSNKVDHLVVGAPHASGAAANKLTMHITSAAPCTVTVVRTADQGRIAEAKT